LIGLLDQISAEEAKKKETKIVVCTSVFSLLNELSITGVKASIRMMILISDLATLAKVLDVSLYGVSNMFAGSE
jgi:hypothetical protein